MTTAHAVSIDDYFNSHQLRRVRDVMAITKMRFFGQRHQFTFWTADLRVTASTSIVLIMIRAPPWSWQVPTRRGPTGGSGRIAGGGFFVLWTQEVEVAKKAPRERG